MSTSLHSSLQIGYNVTFLVEAFAVYDLHNLFYVNELSILTKSSNCGFRLFCRINYNFPELFGGLCFL
jgi:hypothetical protein